MSLSKDNTIYPLYLNDKNLYNISLDKEDLLNKKILFELLRCQFF